MVIRTYRHRGIPSPKTSYFSFKELPKITVQLPIFNELNVVERLLDAIAKLEYPQEKLEIQVLDDSSDETQLVCKAKVDVLRRQQFNIDYLHRDNRQGFKAGALDYGLAKASGSLVAIFDADFIPPPGTLLKMVGYFTDPKVAMVQARWGHVNRHYSSLTELQALIVDAHFLIEQAARHYGGFFFSFNGTAGMWRVSAIQDAGGWKHRTVTEDFDLSYRAQLRGWKFIFVPDIVVPAELPMEISAFKSQQYRWAKGGTQVAKLLLKKVLLAKISFPLKLEAFIHLTGNFNYTFLLILILLSLPYQIFVDQSQWDWALLIYIPAFLFSFFNILFFYGMPQNEQGILQHPIKLFSYTLLLMGVGSCIAINQSLAIVDGFISSNNTFIRTPKQGIVRRTQKEIKLYRVSHLNKVIYLEVFMLFYLLLSIILAVVNSHFSSIPFLLIFFSGYLYVTALSLLPSQ